MATSQYAVCPICNQLPCEFFIGLPCTNQAASKAAQKKAKGRDIVFKAYNPPAAAWRAENLAPPVIKFYDDLTNED